MEKKTRGTELIILMLLAVCTCWQIFPENPGDGNKIPWKVGQTVSYRFIFDGKEIGTDSFTIDAIEKQGDRLIFNCRTELKLQGRTARSSWKIDQRGKPIEYQLEGKVGATSYSIHCRFGDGTVDVEASQAGNRLSRSLSFKENTRLIDNNNLSLFAFLLSSVPREAGRTMNFSVFHPTSLKTFPLGVNVSKRETITLASREIQAWRLEISLGGTPLTMWVDDEGRLLKDEESDGRMIIEWIDEALASSAK